MNFAYYPHLAVACFGRGRDRQKRKKRLSSRQKAFRADVARRTAVLGAGIGIAAGGAIAGIPGAVVGAPVGAAFLYGRARAKRAERE